MQKVQRSRQMKQGMPMCGPFLSASIILYGLSENLYQQRLVSEAIDMYCEYEKKIKDAIDNNDDADYIASLKKESEYYDQVFEISIANVLSLDEA
jgi:hypothetical protein